MTGSLYYGLRFHFVVVVTLISLKTFSPVVMFVPQCYLFFLVNGSALNGRQRAQDDFNSELKQRLSRISLNESQQRSDLAVSLSAQVFIDSNSTPEEVDDWLRKKGFQDTLVDIFHLSYG